MARTLERVIVESRRSFLVIRVLALECVNGAAWDQSTHCISKPSCRCVIDETLVKICSFAPAGDDSDQKCVLALKPTQHFRVCMS